VILFTRTIDPLPLLMKLALMVLLALFAASSLAAEGPYDETADASLEVQRVLADAATARTSVLVEFGANWCADCKVLDMTMRKAPTSALVSREFKVVKVDVGRFDGNVDLATAYGVPLKSGIPAIAILSPRRDVLYATRAGELAEARKMGDAGIHAFFKRAAASARPGT
jgi:protein disulfide-isomerase